jgi:hypothetical protein
MYVGQSVLLSGSHVPADRAKMTADSIYHVRDSPLNIENVSAFCTSDHQYCELLKSEVQVLHKEVKSLTEIINLLSEELKVVCASK